MLKVPLQLQKKYDRLLMNSNVPLSEYSGYKKWLRFYLDFCKKYQHAYIDPQSLSLFINKLKEKNQKDSLRSQAQKAVELYYSGIEKSAGPQKEIVSTDKIHEDVNAFEIKKEKDPWSFAVEALNNEIKVRHYSKKTLKAYSLWAEKFRYFEGV
ncbi:MAG: hypothetical protein KKD66_24360 [Proteobacteria bacterium]|nr:hypothetical protein [Pseudomonadota bacterium]